ncbi:DUF3261 domain-containing protein [Massilia violaceinigra]|uniref:DUF3261 domain-containing protein n=1 Tax=Massilia violaceinigra TaxID=2045208 RepID=A0ABY4A534_9BURK|nr:DUF3261 domain-containing protein [Massilia violaceinigra]UOD29851.1 DUF3261 domain-containing protein [Massilia violaceinigra]
MLNPRLLAALLAATLLGACTTPPAPLARLGIKLAPSALEASISVQQHLKVERKGRIDELDAAVEVDPQQVQMVGLAFGQRVLSLNFDGKELTSWRHMMLPRQVRADDVLEDMQLTLWPAEAIARSLPPGWRIEDAGLSRTLYLDGAVVATITYTQMPRWSGTVTLDNLRYDYRLTIESAP